MHASDTGELAFEDVRVPAENLLGAGGQGLLPHQLGAPGRAAGRRVGCVAGAERMFEQTLEYAKEREAFGRPIGKFQAIRHKFAEMATKIEAAKQLTYSTAWRFANGEYPVREITMAKLYASRIACEVADECIQIHGGYGYMKEYESRARLPRHPPEPDRRRHRRDHARGDRALLRDLGSRPGRWPSTR